MLTTLSIKEIEPGMDVVFVDDTFNIHPFSTVDVPFESNVAALRGKLARVVIVQPDVPGKKVGIVLKEPFDEGLSLDNRLPPRLEKHGAWVLPEHLYTPEMYQLHKDSAAACGYDFSAVEKLLEDFIP